LIISTVFFLSGCATDRGGFCDVASAIRPSQADVMSDGTKRQIVAHNDYGAKTCGWGRKE
jgi:hypothetical protein